MNNNKMKECSEVKGVMCDIMECKGKCCYNCKENYTGYSRSGYCLRCNDNYNNHINIME